jgi:hypothetical protein
MVPSEEWFFFLSGFSFVVLLDMPILPRPFQSEGSENAAVTCYQGLVLPSVPQKKQ